MTMKPRAVSYRVMRELNDIVKYLDEELCNSEITDYPGAMNGLQLENDGKVTKVGAAVDASLPVFKKAIEAGVDFLIVHHGMFWHGAQRVVKAQYEKLKLAMDNNMAVYSSHIPLDIHSQWGNNVILARALGLDKTERFHPWKGELLGLRQKMNISLGDLIEKVKIAVKGEVLYCPGGNTENVGMVGIITGGAGSEIQAMADAGVDTFITGEGPHWSYPLAEELEINVIWAGHYATETFGVAKIAEILSEKYLLCNYTIDHPTGL